MTTSGSADLALAFDLGTGGCKASLWSAAGECLAENVHSYPTTRSAPGFQEQSVTDWWDAIVGSTQALFQDRAQLRTRVAGLALSGQSLGVVQLDGSGRPLSDQTPIWSDSRATAQAERIFERLPESTWYQRTGNGFSPPLYPIFKMAWFAEHDPRQWQSTRHVLGSKDYLNFLLTGVLATDASYASGSGCFNLASGGYDAELMAAAGVNPDLLPPVVASTRRIGTLQAGPAAQLSLPVGTAVFAGGVDNACMALGSRGTTRGRAYASLGSSSWITVTLDRPVLDEPSRPFVFAHVVPGLYISALSTFSSGTTLEWVHELLGPSLTTAELIDEALTVPVSANRPVLLPMLAGGTPLEGGSAARGGLLGLDLSHGRPELVRATLEGIAFALRRSLNKMVEQVGPIDELLITGGGSRHDGWNQLYADILGVPVFRTTVGQQAATLGAAALVFRGAGLWRDFTDADALHHRTRELQPHETDHYADLRRRFDAAVTAATL